MFDYSLLRSGWVEDRDGLDVGNRSWFHVANGLIGVITEFLEADGETPYYTLDVFVLSFDSSMVKGKEFHSSADKRIWFWDVRTYAEDFMENF